MRHLETRSVVVCKCLYTNIQTICAQLFFDRTRKTNKGIAQTEQREGEGEAEANSEVHSFDEFARKFASLSSSSSSLSLEERSLFRSSLLSEFVDLSTSLSAADEQFSSDLLNKRLEQYLLFHQSSPLRSLISDLESKANERENSVVNEKFSLSHLPHLLHADIDKHKGMNNKQRRAYDEKDSTHTAIDTLLANHDRLSADLCTIVAQMRDLTDTQIKLEEEKAKNNNHETEGWKRQMASVRAKITSMQLTKDMLAKRVEDCEQKIALRRKQWADLNNQPYS